jgi:hypothetical protein
MDITLFLLRYGPALVIWLAVLVPLFMILKRLARLELRRRS